uniref:Uncharacterized protein n=1 Tax=Nelumbo nucifera TaxID=4432 RepID=A0A822ZK12_NELNU|nr:TPA_asm: hypothetical protein HUJ06_003293 [Nelumbo nucifera]
MDWLIKFCSQLLLQHTEDLEEMKVAVNLVFVLLLLAVSSEVVRSGSPRLPFVMDFQGDQKYEIPCGECMTCCSCFTEPGGGKRCDICCEH